MDVLPMDIFPLVIYAGFLLTKPFSPLVTFSVKLMLGFQTPLFSRSPYQITNETPLFTRPFLPVVTKQAVKSAEQRSKLSVRT